MTTARTFSDAEGTLSDGCNEPHQCRRCGLMTAKCQSWESSDGGYEDWKYTCQRPECGCVWWVDGIDS